MGQEIDYAAVLEDLEARRAALDGAISVLRQLVGTGALEAVLVPPPSGAKSEGARNSSQTPSEVTPGLFHGLSVAEAARKFLEMTKAKQRTVDITAALKRGGIESAAGNFYSNVFTTMMRRKDFIKLGKYWALAEWYPTRAAASAAAGKTAKKTRRRKPRRELKKRQERESAPSSGSGSSEAA